MTSSETASLLLNETPAQIRRRLEAGTSSAQPRYHLDAAARLYGDNPAWIPIERDEPPLSYREIAGARQPFGKCLRYGRNNEGLPRRDRSAQRRPEFLAGWLGSAKLGAILIPIDPSLTAHELEHILDDGDVEDPLAPPPYVGVLRQTNGRRQALGAGEGRRPRRGGRTAELDFYAGGGIAGFP